MRMAVRAGRPDFGVDFGDIKPKALVVAAAAVLLVMGKPLSGSKTFGNVVLRPPQLEHDLFGTVCGTILNPEPHDRLRERLTDCVHNLLSASIR